MQEPQRMEKAFKEYAQFRNDGLDISKYAATAFCNDPSRWLFKFARYKHVSRLMSGLDKVLEIGASDCLGSPLVADKVKKLFCIEEHIELHKCAKNLVQQMGLDIELYNGSFPDDYDALFDKDQSKFDGIFCLDVLEHIEPSKATKFLQKCSDILTHKGVFICGIPSLESQVYASAASKAGHVNCMKIDEYKKFLSNVFENVFIFGINDEALHTGFGGTSHYLLALCVSPSKSL